MSKRIPIATVALTLVVSVAFAQQLFVYPKKGQSPDQQARDQATCAEWAKSQSGVDPSAACMEFRGYTVR